jgi:prepilin-type processing-associated H-X9-DG protein
MVFVAGVGLNDNLRFLPNMSAIQDPSRYVACGDTGRQFSIWDSNGLAFPDTCALSFCDTGTSCGIQKCQYQADWENCPETQICGLDVDETPRFFNDPSYQKTFARHLGGSNIGYVDGHARWSLYKSILVQSEPFKDPYFEGICACWPGNGTIPLDLTGIL